MANWIQDRNIFLTRHKIDPGRRDAFIDLVSQLLTHAAPYYDEGCKFAFHGFARDPNEWIAIASWDEAVANRLRATPEFKSITAKMMDCCVEPLKLEYFAGMKTDRSIFDMLPAGDSKIHAPGTTLGTQIV